MIDLSKLNIERLMDVCAVANSPMYIYRHFIDDFSVQYLSKHGARSLIESANEILGDQELNLEHATKAYALLVALNFVDWPTVNAALEELKIPRLRWADELLNIIRMNKTGFCSAQVKAMPLITKSVISGSSSPIVFSGE